MKIVDVKEITTNRGKKELNAGEVWLFDKENKKVRLTALMNMENEKAAVIELSEFGSSKKRATGMDDTLNRVFVLGEIPLIARARSDNTIIIKKLEKFDKENYSERAKQMSANRIEIVKTKLAEVLA